MDVFNEFILENPEKQIKCAMHNGKLLPQGYTQHDLELFCFTIAKEIPASAYLSWDKYLCVWFIDGTFGYLTVTHVPYDEFIWEFVVVEIPSIPKELL